MADIKTRTVDKTSIKTMDQSISASHRIRDAGAEIKHAGRQEIDSSEQSVSEYSTARFENAIHRTVALSLIHICGRCSSQVPRAGILYKKLPKHPQGKRFQAAYLSCARHIRRFERQVP